MRTQSTWFVTRLTAANKFPANEPQPILKRRIALLQSMKRVNESITCLVDYLDHFPTDVEGWVQLAELYHLQGLSAQAIFSLEEALLITPNAWNVRFFRPIVREHRC